MQVETKDALLHAINEEFVEAVEVLLEHEETIHKEGEPHVSTITIKNIFKGCHPGGMDLKFIIVHDKYIHHIK